MASIDASTTAVGGFIQLYKYEPFANSFQLNSNASPGSSLSFARSSTELYQFLTNPTTTDVSFVSLNGPNTSYSADLRLAVDEVSSSVILQSLSNTVRISTGRFVTPPSGSVFALFKNEPLTNTFPAGLDFVGSIPINVPITVPSLPVGVSWQKQSATTYRLVGTPTIQTLTSNYNIIGTDVCGSRTISTRTNLGVGAERMLVDLSGSTLVSNLVVGSNISPRGVSIRIPPYGSGFSNKIRYTWTPALPEGFSFRTAFNTVFPLGGTTPDASSSVVLVGAPTSAALSSFSNTLYDVTLTATRTTSPFLTSTLSFSFGANETILFDPPNVQSSFYTNAPITASAFSNSFRARTQFAVVDSSITTIFSPNLRSDLSLVFLSNQQRADLSGIPSSPGSSSFTVRAINAVGTTADLPVSLVVNNDVVSFDYSVTPALDTCSTFIVGRSLSNSKPGYYTASRTFRATALSSTPLSLTTTSLAGTGLSFDSSGGVLSGTPIAPQSLAPFAVTATSSLTGASATTSIQYSVVPDLYTFNTLSLQFVQNFLSTPVQIQATTLSELPVLNYFSSTIPTGLSLTGSGRLTGTLLTDTSSSFTIVASTGFTTGSNTYSYAVRPDSMIVFTPCNSYSYLAGADVLPIPIVGVTYSGTAVSNFQFSNLSPLYGLTLDSTAGLLDGVLTDSIPPNDVLPPSSNFGITARANLLVGTLPITLSTSNPIVFRSSLLRNKSPDGFLEGRILASDGSLLNWQSNAVSLSSSNGFSVATYQFTELQRKTNTLDDNVILAPAVGPGIPAAGRLYRSTLYGSVFAETDVSAFQNLSSVTNQPGTSTWWAIGAKSDICLGVAVFARSDTDGLTWSDAAPVQMPSNGRAVFCRDGTGPVSLTANSYTTAGSVLRYKDGILMAGGLAQSGANSIALLRSQDSGVTWSSVGGAFSNAVEVATLSLADTTRWIVAGSTLYSTNDPTSTYPPLLQDATTLAYSDDRGLTWDAGSNSFNVSAYDIAYGTSTWLATGVRATNETKYYPELKYSTNGAEWSDVTQLNSLFSGQTAKLVPPLGIGPILFDGTNWNVLVCQDPSGTNQFQTTLYTHPDTQDLATDWTAYTDVSGLPTATEVVPYGGFLPPLFTRTGDPIRATLTMNTFAGAGPTILSPSETTLLFYQYMEITPLVFSAVGSGSVYFFLDTASLPLGLTWNPVTQTISGAPVGTGLGSFTVYSRDDTGITTLVFRTNTIIPRIIRKQDGAGAYTSLLRQYTLVNAAQSARDSRAFPTQERALGEFMAPQAPSVVTPSNCPC